MRRSVTFPCTAYPVPWAVRVIRLRNSRGPTLTGEVQSGYRTSFMVGQRYSGEAPHSNKRSVDYDFADERSGSVGEACGVGAGIDGRLPVGPVGDRLRWRAECGGEGTARRRRG